MEVQASRNTGDNDAPPRTVARDPILPLPHRPVEDDWRQPHLARSGTSRNIQGARSGLRQLLRSNAANGQLAQVKNLLLDKRRSHQPDEFL